MSPAVPLLIGLALAELAAPVGADASLAEARRLILDGRYFAAEDLAREALARTEARSGVESPEAAAAIDVLVEALGRGGKYAREETLELARRAVRLKEEAGSRSDSSLARSRSGLSWILFQKLIGQPAAVEAIEMAEQALALQERALGPDHLDVADTLEHLGMMYAYTYAYQNPDRHPMAPLERSLAIRERLLGRNHLLVGRSLVCLGEAGGNLFSRSEIPEPLRNAAWDADLARTGPVPESYDPWAPSRHKRALERALAIYDESAFPDHPEKALALWNLSSFERERETRQRLLLQALEIGEKNFGHEHPDVGWTLLKSCQEAWMAFDAEDLKQGQEAIAVFERTLGRDHFYTAEALYWVLVTASLFTGDYLSAAKGWIEVAPLYERFPDQLGAPFLYAVILVHLGRYAEAKPALERIIQHVEDRYGSDLQDRPYWRIIDPFLEYARLLYSMGDLRGAREILERIVPIAERWYAQEGIMPAMYFALPLARLAEVHLALGDTRSALNLARRAAGLSGDADDYVTLGRALQAAELPDSARLCYERALRVRERYRGSDHPSLTQQLFALGAFLDDTGDHVAALPFLQRAVAFAEANGPTPELARRLVALARTEWRLGEEEQAFAHAVRAEQIGCENLRLAARGLAEPLAAQLASSRVSALDVILSLAPGTKHERAAWDALIRARAVVLDEMTARHRLVRGVEQPEVVRLIEAHAAASQRLAALVVRGPGLGPPEWYSRALGEARRAAEQAAEELARVSAPFRHERERAHAGLDEVSAMLPEGSALLAFAAHESTAPGKSEASILAFVLRARTGDVHAVPLGSASEIEALVRRWSGELAHGALAESVDAKHEAACRAAGARLRERIWDPVATHLDDARLVFIVPDGALHLVNFAALPTDDAAYLVETGTLWHYLSAERDLLPAHSGGEARGLLAIGGPEFDREALGDPLFGGGGGASPASFRGERSACGDFASLVFEPLPATVQEVDEVAAIWKRGADPETIVLRGGEATETSFKQMAAGKRVLHLATHGFFLSGLCPSALPGRRGIGGVTMLSASDPLPPVAGENPLLLAGLAFAGANYRNTAPPDADDGVLTAQEIATLDLSSVEWAVLSGCDTGAGQVRTGEGVFGLRRAFQVAGARTLVMSLWSVEDEAARSWMRALYEARFMRRLSTAEAVREASLARLHAGRAAGTGTDPARWAAFVATGDWR